jgi:hypothetical protein
MTIFLFQYIYFSFSPFSLFTGLLPFHSTIIDFSTEVYTNTFFMSFFLSFFLPIYHVCKLILILFTHLLFILFLNFYGLTILSH